MVEAKSMKELMFNNCNVTTAYSNGEFLSIGKYSSNVWPTSEIKGRTLMNICPITSYVFCNLFSLIYKITIK